MKKIKKDITDWLISGDPSIRWQVISDLMNEADDLVIAERERISIEGWGNRILSFQNDNGMWSNKLYNGKWISTTYSLLLLWNFGIFPNSKTEKACQQLMIHGLYNNEEIRFSSKQKRRDNGVTGLALGILSYFKYNDNRIHNIVNYLINVQNKDGSWFYDNRDGVEKYSFETTMIILKGIREYRKSYSENTDKIVHSEKSGQEFLLKHYLFQDKETNEIINQKWLKLSFPYYWFYDILVALDYFREINVKDKRLEKAIEIIKGKQNPDGNWKLENKHAGKTFFEMEQVGKPSRWNTLRCLRVIEWWKNN